MFLESPYQQLNEKLQHRQTITLYKRHT